MNGHEDETQPTQTDQRRRPKGPALLEVTPPRTGERTLLGVENLLQSIAAPEPFALELAGQSSGVSLLARCSGDDLVRAQIAAHYPQARVRELDPDEDPLRLSEDEQAWSITLRPSGPPYAPLRAFRDRDLLDPGSDPCWPWSAPWAGSGRANAWSPGCGCGR